MGRCKRDGKTVPRLNWPLSTSSPSSPSSSPSSSSLTFEGGGKVDQAVPAHRWKRASWEEIWIAPRRWAWRALRGQLGRVRNSLTIRCLLIFFVQFCFLMTSCVKCQCKGMGLPRRPLTATHWSWQEGLCVLLILRHETFKTQGCQTSRWAAARPDTSRQTWPRISSSSRARLPRRLAWRPLLRYSILD